MDDIKVTAETATPDTYDVFVGTYKMEDGYHKMYVKSDGTIQLGELVDE